MADASAAEPAPDADDPATALALGTEERELLEAWRALSEDDRALLLEIARLLARRRAGPA